MSLTRGVAHLLVKPMRMDRSGSMLTDTAADQTEAHIAGQFISTPGIESGARLKALRSNSQDLTKMN